MSAARVSLAPYAVTALIIAAAAGVLLAMGREPICTCGEVRLWYGDTYGPGNSQHISDWYTPSHLIHGFLFYAALWWAVPRLSFGWRLAAATVVEVAWEIVENTDALIERYRGQTVSLDYYGDSVLNSTTDSLTMVLGFWMAARLPVWLTAAIALGFEILTTLVIRDGLTLNIIMLLWPSEAILEWQSG
ncbi:hypothetical protein C2I36_12575 [Rhodobacteraceae bacterium WD3A24]|nr:hypothetical protein C2I36_12575 [Rhodobacteraceae bacterium WD3A24]